MSDLDRCRVEIRHFGDGLSKPYTTRMRAELVDGRTFEAITQTKPRNYDDPVAALDAAIGFLADIRTRITQE